MQNKLNSSIQNTQDDLSPEFHFLITCCKYNLDEDDIALIFSYFNIQHPDPNKLISLANQHGILPVIYKTLKKLSQSDFTFRINHSALLTDLKSVYTDIAQKNMLMSAELIRIMKLLEKNGIKSLSFKGPTLSQMVYGDITLRQYSDLDILIKEEDRDKISRLLKSQRYKPLYSLTSAQDKVWYTHAKDISFIHPDKKTHIEIHWLLLDRDYPLSFDMQKIWEQSQPFAFKGNTLEIFNTEDLLIYLCIHGSKHLWERIGWIKDIDLMVRTQNIDWDVVGKDLNSEYFDRMVCLGLHLSRQFFSTPLPDFILEKIETQKEIDALEQFVLLDWQKPQGMISNTVAMLRLFPTLSMKLQYLFKVIFKPSQNEYRFIGLPHGLYWAYYFIRPFLLLKKYLVKS